MTTLYNSSEYEFSLPAIPAEEVSWMYDTRNKLRFDPNRTAAMHTRNLEKFKKDFDEIYKHFKEAVKRYRKSGQNNSKWSDFCLYKPEDGDHPGNRMPMVWLLGHAIGVTGLDAAGLRHLEDTIQNACDETMDGNQGGSGDNIAGGTPVGGQQSRKRTAATARDDRALEEISKHMMNSDDLGSAIGHAFQADKNVLSKDEEVRTLRVLATNTEGQVDSETARKAQKRLSSLLGLENY